jgi:hypothetical protein
LGSRSYYSSPEEPDGKANIEINYAEIRDQVAEHHRNVNFRLSLMTVVCSTLLMVAFGTLIALYRTASQYWRTYHLKLTAKVFFTENLASRLAAVRQDFFQQQQRDQEQVREREKLSLLKYGWGQSLRSALTHIADDGLRARIEDCLAAQSPDLEQMKALWMEVQERTQTTPAEKLELLLESLLPYCTEEEYQTCRAEGLEIFKKSGYKPARKFAISMHDQFKRRAREMEELEQAAQSVSDSNQMSSSAPPAATPV